MRDEEKQKAVGRKHSPAFRLLFLQPSSFSPHPCFSAQVEKPLRVLAVLEMFFSQPSVQFCKSP